jgi:hypothetical protein
MPPFGLSWKVETNHENHEDPARWGIYFSARVVMNKPKNGLAPSL